MICWLDIETTGLDPKSNCMLELSFALATEEKPTELLNEFNVVIGYLGNRFDLDPFVREMHTKNGLFEECANSRLTVSEAEMGAFNALPELPEKQKYTLAGNSIHFDLSFLKEHMPMLAARFNYRLLDVSAVNLFCLGLGMSSGKKESPHRASDDVRASANQYAQLREWVRSHRYEDG